MSSFFTGEMPTWGSAATGSAAAGGTTGGSPGGHRMLGGQERRDRLTAARESAGYGNLESSLGNPDDWENPSDWFSEAAKLRPELQEMRNEMSTLRGDSNQPPHVGSPQSVSSTQVRTLLQRRFARRFP